ncbi:MAG: polysaccharide deacetylase family protein [Bacteroidota bacterium]
MYKCWLYLIGSLLLAASSLEGQNLATRLGFAADAKLLIIHADDLGCTHSTNQASFKALEEGVVNSASIMMPTPWVAEVAEYARTHPEADLGLHLTLTSEWEWLKWGPVASLTEVPSLVDSNGYFYPLCHLMAAGARPAEVKIELRAQIERAYRMGIEPTHLDSHMGCLIFSSTDIFRVYLELGRTYGLPILIEEGLPEELLELVTPDDIVITASYCAEPRHFASEEGLVGYYENLLRNLGPGVHDLLIHCAHNDRESKGMAPYTENYGAAWRQADYDFFRSIACDRLLQEQDIQLVTWRQIKALLE